jgi:hypothetical protein
MELADAVRDGVAALRDRRPEAAIPLLRLVAEDAEFAEASDLADLRTRVLSLLAQACLEAGAIADAETWAKQALRLAKRTNDETGLVEIRSLQARIFQAVTDEHQRQKERDELRRVAATPIERLLHGVEAPQAVAAVYVQKANAEVEAGRPREALALAREAARIADDAGAVRERVLARLTLARVAPARADASLNEAWQIAADAGEFNLVGAIGRAAELAGVALPTLRGPDLSRRTP